MAFAESGIKIIVDGRSVGRTPKRVKLSVGKHRFKFISPSGSVYTRSKTIQKSGNKIHIPEF